MLLLVQQSTHSLVCCSVISGEALPVRDKLTTYTFIDKGSVVYAAIQLVDIFRNARNLSSLMIENVDLYGLATFPATLAKLETLCVRLLLPVSLSSTQATDSSTLALCR